MGLVFKLCIILPPTLNSQNYQKEKLENTKSLFAIIKLSWLVIFTWDL